MPHLDDTQVRQKASYIVSYATPSPAPAGNEKTTTDKVKETFQTILAKFSWVKTVVVVAFWTVAIGLGAPLVFFSHLASNTTPENPYTGTPGMETSSGTSLGTALAAGFIYAGLVLSFFVWGILARKSGFTQQPRNGKLFSFTSLAYTWATKRFILATVAFFTIWQSWGVDGLIIFVVAVIALYLFDQRTANKQDAETKITARNLEIANAEFVFLVQGVPTIYTHRGLYSEDEVRGQKMPNSWVFVRQPNGVDVYEPKAAPAFVPSQSTTTFAQPTGTTAG